MRSPRSVSPSTSQDPSAGRGPAGGQLLPDFPEAKTKSCRARAEPPCVQEVRPTRSSERLSLPASGKRAIVPAALSAAGRMNRWGEATCPERGRVGVT